MESAWAEPVYVYQTTGDINVKNVPMGYTVKLASKIALENRIALVTAVAKDILENANVLMDGTGNPVMMK